MQFGYAKSFYKFAPIGPAIWSTKDVPDPQKLKYVTMVNGNFKQETAMDDMIQSVAQIIQHLRCVPSLRLGL
jgi:transcription initiation factor TFIIH subunit 2